MKKQGRTEKPQPRKAFFCSIIAQEKHLNSLETQANMELSQQFEKAVLESKDLSNRPSQGTLLELYSLYKQAKEGDVNSDGPANPFDFVAKAKFEAWQALKGKTRDSAMSEYINLVTKLKE